MVRYNLVHVHANGKDPSLMVTGSSFVSALLFCPVNINLNYCTYILLVDLDLVILATTPVHQPSPVSPVQ